MNILVATDGVLSADLASDCVARFYSDGDTVEVFTAVNVPTEFLRGLGDSGIESASQIALEAAQGLGDRAAEQLAKPSGPQALHGDKPVLKALATAASRRTQPIVDALLDRGVPAKGSWATSENRTARTVLARVKSHDIGLLVIGSHGHGRFEGLLGSTGTKLVRLSPAPVLVIKDPNKV